MEQWLQTISIVLGIIISAVMIWRGIKATLENQFKKLTEQQTKTHKANNFLMEMLFEIIDILDGKKINGQVKELRKKAEQFNIKN
jgi:ABC-type nickel/cobalt efflux system permease component RcnA